MNQVPDAETYRYGVRVRDSQFAQTCQYLDDLCVRIAERDPVGGWIYVEVDAWDLHRVREAGFLVEMIS